MSTAKTTTGTTFHRHTSIDHWILCVTFATSTIKNRWIVDRVRSRNVLVVIIVVAIVIYGAVSRRLSPIAINRLINYRPNQTGTRLTRRRNCPPKIAAVSSMLDRTPDRRAQQYFGILAALTGPASDELRWLIAFCRRVTHIIRPFILQTRRVAVAADSQWTISPSFVHTLDVAVAF